MKILVTGIAGLLGSRLADWIVKNTDHEVIGIDDLSGGYLENIPPNCQFYQEDIVNLQKVKEIFEKESPDIVYHSLLMLLKDSARL